MMEFRDVANLLSELTLLKYFPAEDQARLALARMVGQMAEDEEQVRWLVQRLLVLFNEWPGPLVIRQVFCSKFIPRDGIEVFSTAEFPAGVPSQLPAVASPLLALPAGFVASVDPELERAVLELAVAKDLNGRGGQVHEISLNPDFKRIKQADVDRAVEANHAERGALELHGPDVASEQRAS